MKLDSIGRVLVNLPPGLVREVVVVDSNSQDQTARSPDRWAHESSASRAADTAARARRASNVRSPDVVVFLDGDYSDRPEELPRLLEPLGADRADIVIGSRLAGQRAPGALPPHSVLGNRFVARLLRLLWGVPVTDLGPFRAARYAVLQKLRLRN